MNEQQKRWDREAEKYGRMVYERLLGHASELTDEIKRCQADPERELQLPPWPLGKE